MDWILRDITRWRIHTRGPLGEVRRLEDVMGASSYNPALLRHPQCFFSVTKRGIGLPVLDASSSCPQWSTC